MKNWIHLIVLFVLISTINGELISLIAGSAVALSGGAFWVAKDYIKCRLYECCQEPYLNFNPYAMNDDLEKLVFGQHLVKNVVINAIKSHWQNQNPRKPLVLSFHGITGSGKNFVTEIIANNTYKAGLRSDFVKHFVATNDFPDVTRMNYYQRMLREKLIQTVSKCQRSIIVFDETDKLPEKLLIAVKPFLDYYSKISEVDFRKSIFIFLSNSGGDKIAEITLRQYEAGYPREKLKLEDFERELMNFAFNSKGGLAKSELISNQLIDHFVPFLPLQREHVKKCVEAYLKLRGYHSLLENSKLIENVLNSLQYFPNSSKAFSSSGCKRVDSKTDLEVSKHWFSSKFEDDENEF